jgi:adenylate cyclase
MNQKGVKRKLAAILSADVKGYSRLMEEDEVTTVRTLEEYRAIVSGLVEKHHGRVVDSPGDNLLAQFTSVVDAMEAAVEIQKELKAKNADLPENRRMEFRIGINLGDVIEEGERIYGDGVNIAARLESLADPGGICISRTAYDQVKKKLELGYEYLGDHAVKNITEPVRVYRVITEPEAAGKVIGERKLLGRVSRRTAISVISILVIIAVALIGWNIYLHQSKKIEPASLDKMAHSLPEQPSIAVLPFTNMSDDPKQEYLCDGITDQLITTLSKVPKLFVIARTSAFAYKGKSVKVKQVAEELGVQYVLEGSVQRSGDRVRIIVQLIDAIAGDHLWAERYDRDLKDIFELQDDLTIKIITALRIKLVAGEDAKRLAGGRTKNLQYIEKKFEGIFYLGEFNKASNAKAKQIFEELIIMEPEIFNAYVGLASAHMMDVWLGSSSSPKKSLGEAIKLCKKAIVLDESQDIPHSLLGYIYAMTRQHDKAIEECQRAIDMNPNSASAHAFLGMSLNYAGRPQEAIDFLNKAHRLSPFPPPSFILHLGSAYRETDRYEEAIAEYKKCIKRSPNNRMAYQHLSITYALTGRYEEAREAWSEVLKIDPKTTFKKLYKTCPFPPESCERHKVAMHKAGIKWE